MPPEPRRIKLTQNKFALVDSEDYEYLNQWKWHIYMGYARRREWIPETKGYRTVSMHRLIVGTPDGGFTDHINGNTLDNRKSNLRIVNSSQNARNRGLSRINTSGYKGVVFRQRGKWNYWEAKIGVNNKRLFLGCFHNPIEAARMYNKAAIKYFGEYARVNTI
jgi:hypothetical protein